MCVSKIRILNPGYNPSDFYSRKFIEVSCGHCWQCQQERVNGITFRMIEEVSKPGVIPFFVTFTYAPEYRTILHYQLAGQKPAKLSVWNRQHFQRTIKKIRRQLEYYFGVSSDSLKYLCTCERGIVDEYIDYAGRKRFGQHAPHLHSIFLLNSSLFSDSIRPLPVEFLEYCKLQVLAPDFVSFFRWLLNTRWIYGHVDDIAFARDIVASVRYVCKYINKNFDDPFYKIPLSSYLEIEDKEFTERCESSYRLHQTPPRPISNRDISPRSCFSVNLGLSFVDSLDYCDTLNYLSGVYKVSLPGVKSSTLISLPNYYYNKLCKTVRKLHYDRIYSRRFNTPLGCGVRPIHTSEKFNYIECFDNVHGLFRDARKKVYTSSTLTTLGTFVRRRRFLSAFKSVRDFVNAISSNVDFFLNLFNRYDTLAERFKTCLYYFSPAPSCVFRLSLRDYINVLCGFTGWSYDTYRFAKVCQFMVSHFDHLAREKLYRARLASVAYDNPDLFINHFI